MINKNLLSFELTKDGDSIEIHGNMDGFDKLIKIIQRAIKNKYHEHLLTPDWGGNEL